MRRFSDLSYKTKIKGVIRLSQEQVMEVLQEHGKRITQQRKIFLDVILNGQWECCKEIYYKASKRDSSIGMATVYRMMSTLEEIGIIERRCVFCVKEDIKDHAR